MPLQQHHVPLVHLTPSEATQYDERAACCVQQQQLVLSAIAQCALCLQIPSAADVSGAVETQATFALSHYTSLTDPDNHEVAAAAAVVA